MDIINHACKSILWLTGRVWKKKKSSDLFDVPMGSFHGAEICDLIGLHLLSKLATLFKGGCYGLYRDDGLAIIEWSRPQVFDNIRKKCISIMKEDGFEITIEVGKINTEFLDVSLNLHTSVYKLFRKVNARVSYIHQQSNHPLHIKQALPRMVEQRVNSLSCNKQVFDEVVHDYDVALAKSNYKHKIAYKSNGSEAKKTKRN